MKRHVIVPMTAVFFLSAIACAPAAAQDAAASRQQDDKTTDQAASDAPSKARSFEELDANADGTIGKDEAAVDPRLTQAFGMLDKDVDGRLTPEEYAAYTPGNP